MHTHAGTQETRMHVSERERKKNWGERLKTCSTKMYALGEYLNASWRGPTATTLWGSSSFSAMHAKSCKLSIVSFAAPFRMGRLSPLSRQTVNTAQWPHIIPKWFCKSLIKVLSLQLVIRLKRYVWKDLRTDSEGESVSLGSDWPKVKVRQEIAQGR